MGKSHVMCLAAFKLLKEGRNVYLSFPNDSIKEWDLEVFSLILGKYIETGKLIAESRF